MKAFLVPLLVFCGVASSYALVPRANVPDRTPCGTCSNWIVCNGMQVSMGFYGSFEEAEEAAENEQLFNQTFIAFAHMQAHELLCEECDNPDKCSRHVQWSQPPVAEMSINVKHHPALGQYEVVLLLEEMAVWICCAAC